MAVAAECLEAVLPGPEDAIEREVAAYLLAEFLHTVRAFARAFSRKR